MFHRVFHLVCLALMMAASLYAEDDSRLHPAGDDSFAGFDEPSVPGRSASSIIVNGGGPRALSRGQVQAALATRSVFATASSNFRSLRGSKRALGSNSRQAANSSFGAQARVERGYRAPAVAPVEAARRLLTNVSAYQGTAGSGGGFVDVAFASSGVEKAEGEKRQHSKIDWAAALSGTNPAAKDSVFISTNAPSGNASSGSSGSPGGGAGGSSGGGKGGGGGGGPGAFGYAGPGGGNSSGGENNNSSSSGGQNNSGGGQNNNGGQSSGQNDNTNKPTGEDYRNFRESIRAVRDSVANGRTPTPAQMAQLRSPGFQRVMSEGLDPRNTNPGTLYSYYAGLADRGTDGRLSWEINGKKIYLDANARTESQMNDAMRTFLTSVRETSTAENRGRSSSDRVFPRTELSTYFADLADFQAGKKAEAPTLSPALQEATRTRLDAEDADRSRGAPANPAAPRSGDQPRTAS